MKRPMMPVAVILILIALLRGYIHDREMAEAYVPRATSRCSLEGKVYRKTDDSIYIKDINLISEDAGSGHQTIHLYYNLICKTPEADSVKLGSRVCLEGSYKPYASAMNLGEFDLARYYSTMGVRGYLTTVCITGSSRHYNYVAEGLWWCKERMRDRLNAVYPDRESGTLTAMLLGDRQDLEAEVKDLYKATGIAHILAISGLHITLLGVGVFKLLRKCRLTPAVAALGGIIIMISYGIMTGLGVSCCRAIGMYILRMYAKIRKRTADMLTSLCVVGAVMVIVNPLYLRQTSFQLSFASIAGVSLLSLITPKPDKRKGAMERFDLGILRRREGALKDRFKLWMRLYTLKLVRFIAGSLGAGVCIGIATLPIQLANYYKLPVSSVMVNLLVLPVMSLLAFSALISMLPGLGLVGSLACLALDYIDGVCDLCGASRGYIWTPGCPSRLQIFCYYGALTAIVTVLYHLKRRAGSGRPAWMGVLLIPLLTIAANGKQSDSVSFLYVGQGDCTVIEMADGSTYVYDCGSSDRANVGENILIPFLLYEGRSKINCVFASHSDSDHINGLVELLTKAHENGIEIGSLVLPDLQRSLMRDDYGELIMTALEAGVNVEFMGAGDRVGDNIEALHPTRQYVPESDNASSLCLLVSFSDSSTLMLTGDVDGAGETELVNRIRNTMGEHLYVDILKVAHHGSKYATSEEFLGTVTPRLAVIMAGRNNSYGHPHKETLKRLDEYAPKAKVYRTDECGQITTFVGENGAIIRGFIGGY